MDKFFSISLGVALAVTAVALDALYWQGWSYNLLLVILGALNIALTLAFWIAVLEWTRRQ